MNKKDLLISYILVILTIPFLFQIEYPFAHGAIILSVLLVLTPLLIMSPIKIKSFHFDINSYPCSSCLLFFFLMTFFLVMGYQCGYNNNSTIATTDNIQHAVLIENTITSFSKPVIRKVNGKKYDIAVLNCNNKTFKNIIFKLIDDDIITKDVELNLIKVPQRYSKEKKEKILTKRLIYLINSIPDVKNATINVQLKDDEQLHEKAYLLIDINVCTTKNANIQLLEKRIRVILTSSIKNLSSNNIKITFK